MLHQGHISMKYFVKSVYGRKMRDCDWARSYSPPASPFGRCLGVCFPSSSSSSSFSPSCFWAQNFLLAAFMKPCHAFSWQLTHVADARQGQVKLVRHKDAAGIGSIVVGIVFVLRQDVPLCGGGSPEERGQLADKNYYRPNKRYFSRDECALVRVLFYFVELQPAS